MSFHLLHLLPIFHEVIFPQPALTLAFERLPPLILCFYLNLCRCTRTCVSSFSLFLYPLPRLVVSSGLIWLSSDPDLIPVSWSVHPQKQNRYTQEGPRLKSSHTAMFSALLEVCKWQSQWSLMVQFIQPSSLLRGALTPWFQVWSLAVVWHRL